MLEVWQQMNTAAAAFPGPRTAHNRMWTAYWWTQVWHFHLQVIS